jgi:hypothetical protein
MKEVENFYELPSKNVLLQLRDVSELKLTTL